MNTYQTAEIAKINGVHPNTVRLYEKLNLIPVAERQANGYRIFTDFHIEQFRLARIALQVEIMQNGLRKKAITIVKVAASKNFDTAIALTNDYLKQLQQEKENAEEAIQIVKDLLHGKNNSDPILLKRKETAEYLGVTIDTLRNWELNGLLKIKRKANGYRVYSSDDIRRLRIIRALRCANYSLASILRMLNALMLNPNMDIKTVIGMPKENKDILTACDKLLVAINDGIENALVMRTTLDRMKKYF